MRPRVLLMVAGLFALGMGVGLYAANHVGHDDSVASAPVPAQTTAAAGTTTEAPTPTPRRTRPRFAVAPLPPTARAQLKRGGFWHHGCPVPLSGLRLLTVSYRGFDHQLHTGELVVNGGAAHPLKRAFRRLYRQRVPIRHIGFSDFYGPRGARPRDGDVTASFECRQSVPSPCTGGLRSGHWSMHAYGLAVDLNPTENPYIGCGQSRDPATRPYRDRTRHLRGMVDERVIAAFASIGWGWGGAWTGSTKDYMHFSSTGH
jgi:hypothetical protein